MAVSMGDVARHAGVSQRTVSNVVNNFTHVSEVTRQKVEASLQELGYRPNVAARRLRSGRTGTVTLAIPSFTERYFADLAEAVVARARVSGLEVLVETTGGDHERELSLVRGTAGLLTDGLILSALSIGADDEEEARADYPLVLVGDRELGGGVDHVGIPNRKAARVAVRHLIETGRRRIALLGHVEQPAYSYALRLQGYRRALDDAGIPFDPELIIPSEWSRSKGAEAVDSFLDSGHDVPDAIFAMNDSAAFGAMHALLRRGIRIPDDVALVGFDDVVESRYSTPTLSSIAPSLDEIASSALALLNGQFDAPDVRREAQQRHVGFELRVRESSAGTVRP